jgi:hypothetical protein
MVFLQAYKKKLCCSLDKVVDKSFDSTVFGTTNVHNPVKDVVLTNGSIAVTYFVLFAVNF